MWKKTALYQLLRRLYWWYQGKRVAQAEKQRLAALRKKIRGPLGRKVYIIGTPCHKNLGDSAIVLAQRAFLQRCGWEDRRIIQVTDQEYQRDWQHIRRWIPKNALIAQLGGGHMGNQWFNEELMHRRQLLDLPENPTVIFPQTVFYTPDAAGEEEAAASREIYDGRQKLVLTAREQFSLEKMRALYPNTRVLSVPDIVLSASMETFGARPQQRRGVLLCMRNDLEQVLTAQDREEIRQLLKQHGLTFQTMDMYSREDASPQTRSGLVREKMEQIASARLVITDRLHGMVFCALTGTPCIALSNNNRKVQGTYEWIRYLSYIRFIQSVGQIGDHLTQLLELEGCRFDNQPLQPYYEQLAEVVRKNAYR